VTDPPTVRIALEARAENVTIVRQALAGIAEALAVEPEVLADLKIAVSEACTNVVVHAYPNGEVGGLEIDCWPRADDQLTVVVRDHGAGISPRVTESGPGLGLGLPLIAALAEEIQISSGPGRPTEVTMTFALVREPQDEGVEE
jgi:anti-sigma regulatory factor (Ser/Thr protein kinase)